MTSRRWWRTDGRVTTARPSAGMASPRRREELLDAFKVFGMMLVAIGIWWLAFLLLAG